METDAAEVLHPDLFLVLVLKDVPVAQELEFLNNGQSMRHMHYAQQDHKDSYKTEKR